MGNADMSAAQGKTLEGCGGCRVTLRRTSISARLTGRELFISGLAATTDVWILCCTLPDEADYTIKEAVAVHTGCNPDPRS